MNHTEKIRGRGSSDNPVNRFEGHYVDYQPEERPEYKTRLFRDDTKNIISFNESPDIPFEAGLNPYRGCEHDRIVYELVQGNWKLKRLSP